MNYFDYLKRFQQYSSFQSLVENESKVLDFADKDCQTALQNWVLEWSKNNFNTLSKLFEKKAGPQSERDQIKQILKDTDFARNYLEVFASSFLQHYCGYSSGLKALKEYSAGNSIVDYSNLTAQDGTSVWEYNGKTYPVKTLNLIIADDLKVEPAFINVLTMFWSQTPVKQILISSYLQKNAK